ncbi:MAG: hypothetical protein ACK4NT_01700, partial [Candidatus Omnitrophota bacterium]
LPELFELVDLLTFAIDGERKEAMIEAIIRDFKAEEFKSRPDPLTLLIWRKREDKTALTEIKIRLTNYLYGRRP